MEGFIDPKRFLIFVITILTMAFLTLIGFTGLIIALLKPRKTKSSFTKQKSFVYSMTAFIIAFFVFVCSQVIIK